MRKARVLGRSRPVVWSLLVFAFTLNASAQSLKIGALVSAQVDAVLVKQGDVIEPNQVLIELDKALYAAKLAQAQAQLALHQARFEEAHNRFKEAQILFEDTVTAKREFEGYQRDFLMAKAQADLARAQLAEWTARERYYVIRSPDAGRVQSLFVQVGSTVFEENTPLIELNLRTVNP
jgi:multidrug efflux pump subunit AcrA (membrane-fusion protein)